MEAKLILLGVLFFSTCCLAQDLNEIAKNINDSNDTAPSHTVNFIKKELERFSKFNQNIELKNANVTVRFVEASKGKYDDELKIFKTIGFQPLELKGQSSDEDFPDVSGTQLMRALELARRLNISVVFSREEFGPSGNLVRKQVSIDGADMTWDNGNGSIIIHNIFNKYKMENFDNFVKVLKDYEMPVDIEKVLYNEAGEEIKVETNFYQPRKVTIEDSTMTLETQLAVAEALKRTFAMKTNADDRMKLMCKYLGIVYSDIRWGAVMGSGNHYLNNEEYDWIRLSLDNVTCTVFGRKVKKVIKVEDDDDYDYEE